MGGASDHVLDLLQRRQLDPGGIPRFDGGQCAVQFGVGDAHLPFVGLPGPQAGGGGPLDDLRGHSQFARQFPHLGLVEVPQGQEVHPAIAPLGRVADHHFALVAGTQHQGSARRLAQIVPGDHAQAGLDVGGRQGAVGRRQRGQQRIVGSTQIHGDRRDTEGLGHPLRQAGIIRQGMTGQDGGQNSLGADGTHRQRSHGGRIYPAAEAEGETLGTCRSELIAQPKNNPVGKGHPILL